MTKRIIGLCLAIGLLLFQSSYADLDFKALKPDEYAKQLQTLQLLKGTDHGLELNRQLTRLEGLIMTLRLMGVEEDAKSYYTSRPYFSDVPDWAHGYAEYAYAKGITKGISKGLFGSYQKLGVNEYATFMLRILNYDDQAGDFNWQQALNKLLQLGLVADSRLQSLADDAFNRLEMAELTYGVIHAQPQYGTEQLIDKLVALAVVDYEAAKQLNIVDADNATMPDYVEIINSDQASNYIRLSYQNGLLGLEAKSSDNQAKWLLINIRDNQNEVIFEKHFEFKDNDLSYKQSFNIDDGNYAVDVFVNNSEYGSFSAWAYGGQVVVNNGVMRLAVPDAVWQHNYATYHFKKISLDAILSASAEVQKDDSQIVSLATKIVAGLKTDYDKAKAVYDWVSSNIHYDMDAFNTDNIVDQDAINTLNNKRAVCEGYANLTAALLRSLDIPTGVVYGYALGVDTSDYWVTPFKMPSANHAWNEVYIDGKWLIIDSSWGSNNQYYKGQFNTYPSSDNYFDIALNTFSMTHLIMEYTDQ